jgi:hypothetical protein
MKINIHRTVILSIVLSECETLSLTMRDDEHRLRVFENRMLRGIFGPEWDKVIREWRKLHNEELNDLYCSLRIVRVTKSRMRWAGHVARMGRGGVRIGFWRGNLRESGYFKRQWRILEVNIKICLQGIGWRRQQDLCGSEQ